MTKIIRPPSRFVGLHAHSGFSVFDGLSLPKFHMDYVMSNGMDAWALTDHGNANGHAHAFTHAKDLLDKGKNFKFIPGCEFYLHPDLNVWKQEYARSHEQGQQYAQDQVSPIVDGSEGASVIENEEETKQTKWYDPVRRRHHLVVIAKNRKGLENLYTLITRSYDEGFYRFPRIDYAMLKQHSEGLIVSTACLGGPLSYLTLKGYNDVAWDDMLPNAGTQSQFDQVQREILNEIDVLTDAVGRDNFFVEIQFNRLGAQHLVNKHLIAASRTAGIPLIVTADSHYPGPDLWKDRELYKKLGWLNYDKYEPGQLPTSTDELKAQLYPKNAEQMWESYHDSVNAYADNVSDWSFYDDQEIADAIERTHDIAHQLCDSAIPSATPIFPVRNLLGSDVANLPEDEQQQVAFKHLVNLVKSGLKAKGLDTLDEYIERAREELEVIRDKNFSLYFLTITKIMQIANDNMLVGPGRGSGAGSLVNYVLGITHVDPLKYGLLFSRFLSRARVESPDIDSDVADNDRLKELLREEFGEENVVPVSNFNNFALRSLVKDVSRFYGIDFEEVNRVTNSVEREVKKAVLKPGDDKNVFVLKYEDAMEHSPGFRQFIEKYPQVGAHITILFEQNKSIGRHAGGVVIGDDIAKRMPVIRVRGEKQTSWTEGLHYRHLEARGLLKHDLLGLKTLRIVQRCIELILKDKWTQNSGRYIVQLGDLTLDLLGTQEVITSNRGNIRASEINIDDDIIEVPGLWKAV